MPSDPYAYIHVGVVTPVPSAKIAVLAVINCVVAHLVAISQVHRCCSPQTRTQKQYGRHFPISVIVRLSHGFAVLETDPGHKEVMETILHISSAEMNLYVSTAEFRVSDIVESIERPNAHVAAKTSCIVRPESHSSRQARYAIEGDKV